MMTAVVTFKNNQSIHLYSIPFIHRQRRGYNLVWEIRHAHGGKITCKAVFEGNQESGTGS